MKEKLAPWMPAVFCGFLSALALVGVVSETFMKIGNWWAPAFFSFLPMCFFFVVDDAARMRREIRDLREKVADLERRIDAESL